jgi:photosynthetic reaction center H subunit
MLPINFARVGRDKVKVASILGHHLTDVPRLKNPDEITMLEEERVMAYYGAGTLYAEPSRMGPWI